MSTRPGGPELPDERLPLPGLDAGVLVAHRALELEQIGQYSTKAASVDARCALSAAFRASRSATWVASPVA